MDMTTDPLNPMPTGNLPAPKTDDGLVTDPSGFASFDPNQSATYKGYSDQAAQSSKNKVDLLRQRADLEKNQQPDQFNVQQPPQTLMPEIQKSMVPMMIFTALGGAFTKANGQTMLAAMNGMVQGQLKGDEQARERAWQQYQDTYQKWKAKVEESHRIYEEHKAALGDDVFAEQEAQQFALQQRNDFVAGQNARAGQINKEKQLMLQHEATMAKIKASMNGEKLWKDVISAQDKMQKAKAAYPVMDQADRIFNEAMDAFKRIKGKYSKTKYGSVVPKSFNDLRTALGDDPDVQTFEANMGALNSSLVQIKAALGTQARPSVFLEKMYSKGVPEFWSQSDQQISTLMGQEKQLIDDGRSILDQNVKMWGDTVNEIRANMGASQLRTDAQPDPDITSILQ